MPMKFSILWVFWNHNIVMWKFCNKKSNHACAHAHTHVCTYTHNQQKLYICRCINILPLMYHVTAIYCSIHSKIICCFSNVPFETGHDMLIYQDFVSIQQCSLKMIRYTIIVYRYIVTFLSRNHKGQPVENITQKNQPHIVSWQKYKLSLEWTKKNLADWPTDRPTNQPCAYVTKWLTTFLSAK